MKTTFNTELELSEIQKQLKKLTAQKVKIEKLMKKPNGQMRSVWAINPPKKEEKKFGKHPTQKPLKLFQWCLSKFSKEGQLILDCFSGSGTTAIACHNLNRNFICIEKDYDYIFTVDDGLYNRFKENVSNVPIKIM